MSFWSFEKDADGRVRKVKITELTVIGCIRVVTSDTKNKWWLYYEKGHEISAIYDEIEAKEKEEATMFIKIFC